MAYVRGLDVTLSLDEYAILTAGDCYYCGSDLPQRMGHGLDRINNTIGYAVNNVRACCANCNGAKSDKTEDEFRDWVLRVANHRFNKTL